MITLASDCLLFELATGESIPYSADMVWVELSGDSGGMFDSEFVRHADEGGLPLLQTRAGPPDRVRRGIRRGAGESAARLRPHGRLRRTRRGHARACWSLICAGWRSESGQGCELVFFPRLRAELQPASRSEPAWCRFRGLRGCVKQLTGARRWSLRCQTLEGEIVDYLRECLSAETRAGEFALLVE